MKLNIFFLEKKNNIRNTIVILIFLPFLISIFFSILNFSNLSYVKYIYYKYEIKYLKEDFYIYYFSFIYFVIFYLLIIFTSLILLKINNLFFDLNIRINNLSYFFLSFIVYLILFSNNYCHSFPLKSYIVALEPFIYIHLFLSLLLVYYNQAKVFASINILLFFISGLYNLSLGLTYPLILFLLFTSIFIIYLIIFEKAIKFKQIIFIFICFLLVIITFVSREFLRKSNIINGDLSCSSSLDLNNQDVVFERFNKFECKGISSECKLYKYNFLAKFNYNEYIENKGYKDTDIYVDKAVNYIKTGGSLFNRYDFIKEIANYNLFITKYNIDVSLGKTYIPLLYKYIPRSIYKNKPREDLGLTIPKSFGLHAEHASHSRTVDIFTESFINFYYYGLIVAVLIPLYLFLPYIFFKTRKINFIFCLLMVYLTFNSQSNFSLVYGLYFYQLIFALIYIKIISKK